MVISGRHFRILLGITIAVLSVSFVLAIEPFGATLSPGNPNRSVADAAMNNSAYAGNITPIDITGYSITQTWQGYYGNVTGTITLSDSSDNVMYNWTLAFPSGEVYATTNNTISWPHMQCFNYTASGNITAFNATEVETDGAVNLGGVNLTELEARFGINSSRDVDGVNETFRFSGGTGHDQFFTNNLQFSTGECMSTRVFTNLGPVANSFQEALMYEHVTGSVVFASILENDMTGFNGRATDFEMLVLENGHGTNTDATTYFFYVELE